jgi:hypothetical protein
MELSPGGRAGAGALQDRAEDERDAEPRAEAEQESCEQSEIESLEPVGPSRSHRVGTLLLLAGIVLLQVAWVTLLGYMAYSVWIHL